MRWQLSVNTRGLLFRFTIVHVDCYCRQLLRKKSTTLVTIFVGESAMMVENVWTAQLNVRLDRRVTWLSDLRQAVFQVVQQTLGHQRILVQVHQVWHLHNNPHGKSM